MPGLTPSGDTLRRALRVAAAALRDAWLVFGIALLLLAGVEFGYRAQRDFRLSRVKDEDLRPWRSPLHPQAAEPWWKDVEALRIYGTNIRFDPYRGFWPTAVSSHMVNVGPDGVRRTVQPLASDSGASWVLFLGGSVMWGWIVPDSLTIPSLAAQRLVAGGHRVRVTNLGQPTFQITQEAATLLLELRAGRVPDVVVFLDGANEIAAAYESGAVGRVQNEERFARRFAAGRDQGVFGALVRAGQALAFVQRVERWRTPAPPRGPRPELCPSLAAQYAAVTRAVEALGAEFRFQPVFLWQPLLSTSRKAPGRFERMVVQPTGWSAMAQRCRAAVDSLMKQRRSSTFVDLSDLFDQDSADVFWDAYGHVTESGSQAIADRIVAVIAPGIAARR